MITLGLIGGLVCLVCVLLILYALVIDSMTIGDFIRFNAKLLPLWFLFVGITGYAVVALIRMQQY